MSAAELLNAEQMAEGLYLAREAVEHHCDTDLAVRAFDQLERIQDELNEARATAEICQRAVQTLRLELEAERAKVRKLVEACQDAVEELKSDENYVGENGGEADFLVNLRAAIAKARGER